MTLLYIRISSDSLSFAEPDATKPTGMEYEPYNVKTGISIAANLRNAFNDCEILQRQSDQATALIDTPVLLLPIEEYSAEELDAQYRHVYSDDPSQIVVSRVLPELNAICVFAINKDLKMVLEDHFREVRIMPLMQSVWNFFSHRSYTGPGRKLYCYFHDHRLEVSSYQRGRFMFCNTFEASDVHDVLFFILSVWKNMSLNTDKDELYLLGECTEYDWLEEQLQEFLANVYHINLSAEFNRAQATQQKNAPADVILQFV